MKKASTLKTIDERKSSPKVTKLPTKRKARYKMTDEIKQKISAARKANKAAKSSATSQSSFLKGISLDEREGILNLRSVTFIRTQRDNQNLPSQQAQKLDATIQLSSSDSQKIISIIRGAVQSHFA